MNALELGSSVARVEFIIEFFPDELYEQCQHLRGIRFQRTHAFKNIFKGDDPQGHNRSIQYLQKLRAARQVSWDCE